MSTKRLYELTDGKVVFKKKMMAAEEAKRLSEKVYEATNGSIEWVEVPHLIHHSVILQKSKYSFSWIYPSNQR